MAHDAVTETAQQNTDTHAAGTVLIIGASGSIGCHVVTETLRAGFQARALVRDSGQASLFPEATQVVVADPTQPETLGEALEGVTGIVFTQGTYSDDDAEESNYRPVHTVLNALKAPARIALMTTQGITKPTPGHDWKRRGERLVRASGLPYTIVRPSWFDHNTPDEHHLVLLQGDRRWAGTPEDGVVSRQQIAQVLVASLSSAAADHKTLQLVAEKGEAQADLEPLFAALESDDTAGVDGPQDRDTLPADAESAAVTGDLEGIRDRF